MIVRGKSWYWSFRKHSEDPKTKHSYSPKPTPTKHGTAESFPSPGNPIITVNSCFVIQNEPGTVSNVDRCHTNYPIQSFDRLLPGGNRIACPWLTILGLPGYVSNRGGHHPCSYLIVSMVLSRRMWIFKFYKDRYQIFLGLVGPLLRLDWDYDFGVNQIVRVVRVA